MEIFTHQSIDPALCGRPVTLEEGFSRVELKTTAQMAVDSSGLIHGGFIFGLADYAAMIAVNHPHVVLGAAEVKFVKPVKAGQTVSVEAKVVFKDGKKHQVAVTGRRADETVFQGDFTCFVLGKHVLG
ncbi:MAG: hotdog fold thioesterase [Proteobacteria bacterium]|nr:hotdog fold thioesterase [Pseudomonadota bacterium]